MRETEVRESPSGKPNHLAIGSVTESVDPPASAFLTGRSSCSIQSHYLIFHRWVLE